MKSPREQTRFTEIERACARVCRNVFTRNNNNLKLSKIVSIFPMKIAPPKRTDNLGCTDESLKNFIRESARAKTATLPPRANTKTMSFSLHCSTSTQSSRVSTSSLTSNATSKRVVQRKAFRVRAADAGTC